MGAPERCRGPHVWDDVGVVDVPHSEMPLRYNGSGDPYGGATLNNFVGGGWSDVIYMSLEHGQRDWVFAHECGHVIIGCIYGWPGGLGHDHPEWDGFDGAAREAWPDPSLRPDGCGSQGC